MPNLHKSQRRMHRPYQFSVRAILWGTVAVGIAFGLFRMATIGTGPLFPLEQDLFPLERDFPPFFVQFAGSWRTLLLWLGVVILGATMGAVIGHLFQRDKEGGAIMGVYVGVLASFLGLVAIAIAVALIDGRIHPY